MCAVKNCTVRFAGNCPPLLEWRQSTDGENRKIHRLKSTTTRDEAVVVSFLIEDEAQELNSISCVAVTKSTADLIQPHSCLVIQESGESNVCV